MTKILITSIGSRVSQGILDGLADRRDRVIVVGTNSEADAPNNFRADSVHLVPQSEPCEPFLRALRLILSEERPDLVLAGRDGDLEALASLQDAPEFQDIRFLSPSSAATAVVRDKHRTFAFARAHGLPFAESIIDAAALDDLIQRKGLPLIGKPRTGHGSRGVSVVHTRRQALALLDAGGLMLQEFLGPAPDLAAGLPDFRFGTPLHFAVAWQSHLSLMAIVDRAGEVVARYAVRAFLVGGLETRIVPVDPTPFDSLTQAYAGALARLGFAGPLNIQCHRLADGSLVAFELNARFTGSTSARRCLGFNEVAIALDYFLEGQRPLPAVLPAEPCYVAKPLADQVVREADVRHLAGTGKWTRRP